MLYMIAMSFTDWGLLRKTLHVVGLANYAAIFADPVFLKSLGQHREVRGLRRAGRHRPQPVHRPPPRPRAEGEGHLSTDLRPPLHHARGGRRVGLALDVPVAAPRHHQRGLRLRGPAGPGVPQQPHAGPSVDPCRQRVDRARLLHDRLPRGDPDHPVQHHGGRAHRRRIGAAGFSAGSPFPFSCR